MIGTRGGSSSDEASPRALGEGETEAGRPLAIPSIPPPTDEIDGNWGAEGAQGAGAQGEPARFETPVSDAHFGVGAPTPGGLASALEPATDLDVEARPRSSTVARVPSRHATQLGMAVVAAPPASPTGASSPARPIEPPTEEAALGEPGILRPSQAAPIVREQRRSPATVPPLSGSGRTVPGTPVPLPSRAPTQFGFASPVTRPSERPTSGEPVSPAPRPSAVAAALAADLDRLTAEAGTPPGGHSLAPIAPESVPTPPARDAPTAATISSGPAPATTPPSSAHPSHAPSAPAPSLGVRVLRPTLLGAAVLVGALLIWVAMRPSSSGRPRPEERVGGSPGPATPPAPARASGPPGRERPLAPSPGAASTPVSVASAVASRAVADEASTVRVVIRTKPDRARIFLDGRRVGNSPLAVDLPRGKVRRYSVWLEGHAMRAVVVDGSAPEILLGLVPEAPPPAPAP